MNKAWFKGLTKEETQSLKEFVETPSAKQLVRQLEKLCTSYEEDCVNSMTDDKWYSLDWRNKQASLVAEMKSWKKVKKLVTSLLTKE